ncbi:tetratricopeptide repeat protein [Hugenholtzia roseola]|uniref:tetratricopeptide repeat protein n=1 Tax=Hugenholtzia roseola TaxID=1002 RepID=UPI00047D6007|nr:tetratricopeptide repeat protein [Hugenholtzia roseola]
MRVFGLFQHLLLPIFGFLVLLFPFGKVQAQQGEIDSLETILKETQNDSLQVEILNQLAWKNRNNRPFQSLAAAQEALEIATRIAFTKGQTTALSFMGVAYRNLGKFDQALAAYIEAFNIAQKTGDAERMGYSYINIANVYYLRRDFSLALKQLEKALPIAQALENENMEGYVYTNQARAYADSGQFSEAISAHEKALALRQKQGDTYGVLVTVNEIGRVYSAMGNLDKALEKHLYSLDLALQTEQLLDLARARTDAAKIYYRKQNLDKATKQAEAALLLAQKLNIYLEATDAAQILYQIEKEKQNFSQSLYYHELYTRYRDSVANQTKDQLVSELQVRFEADQKERENQVLKQEQLLNQATIAKQNLVMIGGILILAIFSTLLAVIFWASRKRKKANLLLARQNEQIEQQRLILVEKNEELNLQTENLRTAYREISNINEALHLSHQIIATKNENIIASINYAQRIQLAVLPLPLLLNQYLAQNFIFFQPRDIVSGDFYWFEEKDNRLYLAVADCTGHGVPGAMLSMLGVLGLNTILGQNPYIEPAHFLEKLHYFIYQSLQQSQNHSLDGMEIGLICIDKKAATLTFAGAKSSIFYLQNGNAQKIKGDKFSIGGQLHKNQVPHFTQHALDFSKESLQFYLYSDGFQDQFGGSEGRKLRSRPFENLLESLSDLPLKEQGRKLEQFLVQWIKEGDNTQTDDILVLGAKCSEADFEKISALS